MTEDPLIDQLYHVIETYLDDPKLNVGKLADNMHINRRTLNRKLAMSVKLSANEVIRQYRLERAAMLLKNKLPVSETAYRVGFETPSYFSSTFKAFYGMPPSAYADSADE